MKLQESSDRRPILPVAAAALFALILVTTVFLRAQILVRLNFYLQEDALITMRYAENLAAGQGFVYNAGEHVLGTTTPLYTLILAGLRTAGLDILRLGPVVGLVCALLSIVLVFRWSMRLGRPWAGLLAAALLGFAPRFLFVSVAGMETALFVLLSLGALYAFAVERYLLSVAALAALVLTRPDGIVLGVVLFAAYLLQRRAIPWRPLALFVLLMTPWVLFATLYFGSPIPNSALAKVAAYSQGQVITLAASATRVFNFLRVEIFGPWIGAAVMVGFLLGCYEALRHERRLLPAAAWPLAYFLTLVLFRPGHFFPWYFLTPLGAYCLVAAVGLVGLVQRACGRVAARLGRARQVAAVALAIAVLVGAGVAWHAQYKSQYGMESWWAGYERTFRQAVGVWLHDNTPTDATVLLEPLGYVGYYSQRRMIDLVGLVSPQLSSIRAQAPLRVTLGHIIQLVSADYLVLRESELAWITGSDLGYLDAHYREIAHFSDPNPTLAFRVFEKCP